MFISVRFFQIFFNSKRFDERIGWTMMCVFRLCPRTSTHPPDIPVKLSSVTSSPKEFRIKLVHGGGGRESFLFWFSSVDFSIILKIEKTNDNNDFVIHDFFFFVICRTRFENNRKNLTFSKNIGVLALAKRGQTFGIFWPFLNRSISVHMRILWFFFSKLWNTTVSAEQKCTIMVRSTVSVLFLSFVLYISMVFRRLVILNPAYVSFEICFFPRRSVERKNN